MAVDLKNQPFFFILKKRSISVSILLFVCLAKTVFLFNDGYAQLDHLLSARPLVQVAHPIFAYERNTIKSLLEGYAADPANITMIKAMMSTVVDEYMSWHKRTLDAINSGAVDVKKVRLLVHWSDKGTGDRFRGLFNAYLCAVFSSRFFLLKWEKPFALSRIFHIGVRSNFTYDAAKHGGGDYDIPVKNFTEPIEAFTPLLDDVPLRMMCNWDLNTLRLFVQDVPLYFPNLTISQRMVSLGEQRHAFHRDWMFKLLLPAMFRPTDEFVAHVTNFLLRVTASQEKQRRRRKPPQNGDGQIQYIDFLKPYRPYIGVHVRLGNDTNEADHWRFRHRLPVLETAKCLAERMIADSRNRHLNPPRFFLATDATALRDVLLAELRKLDIRAQLLSPDWPVKHIKDMESNSDEDLTNYLNMFTEIYMLSHAHALVNSNSAFNDLADWLGNITGRTSFEIEKNCVPPQ